MLLQLLMLFYELTTSDHAHGKDGVVGDLWVSIMGKFAECVQDVQTRVGH